MTRQNDVDSLSFGKSSYDTSWESNEFDNLCPNEIRFIGRERRFSLGLIKESLLIKYPKI